MRRGAIDPHGSQLSPEARYVSWVAIAATTLITLPRLTPTGNGDFFSFVSVAERLRSGDRLYADVWDNKDPYFYYVVSFAGSMGASGYYLLELMWVGLAVFALSQLGQSQGMSRQWSVIVAWGVAPWCLVGGAYIGSMTAMPGIALVFAILALAARNRWVWVGLLLGVLFFLKVILVPVAVVGAAVFCEARKARTCLVVLGGLAASTAMGLIALALRSELPSYVEMLRRNSEYADRMVADGALAGFLDHLSKALPAEGYTGQRIAVCAIAVCLALAGWRTPSGSRRLLLCAGVVALSCIAVLGLTAVWSHHAQILALPACLTLVAVLAERPPRDTGRYVALLAGGVLAGYLMGGATPVASLLIKPARAAQPLQQLRGDSPEAMSIADADNVTDYSRLGQNDMSAHARGLGAFELACPHFQQYPFDPSTTFARTLTCLPRSDVVFVAHSFAGQTESASYGRFTSEAEAILRNHFQCTVVDYGRKCLREVTRLR